MSQIKKFDRTGEVLDKIRNIGAVPAANAYEALRSGPQFGRSFEIQPGIPIDGSKRFLRLLSPFTISLVPPLAFESALDQASNNSTLNESPEATPSAGVAAAQVVQLSASEIAERAASGAFNNFTEADFEAFETGEGSQFLGAYEASLGFSIRELSEETFTGLAGIFQSVEGTRAAAVSLFAGLSTAPSEAEFFGIASEDNGESDRVDAETGANAPNQSRNSPGEATPAIGILEATGSRHSSFNEAKAARETAVRQLIGIDVGGVGRNSISAETYVSLGVERQNDRNAFLEPGFADRLTAGDIAAQLQTMLEVPPLTLLINPSTMSIQYTSIQQYSQRTRKGYVFQRWGEEQPVMSISGSIGAFIAGTSPDTGIVPPEGGLPSVSGVQFASKRDSASFQNLMSLLTFYKNAGYIYDTVGNTNANHFVGSLAIDYDQWTYLGQFNSFSWGYDETENQNGKITFEAEFGISMMFDNHQPIENVLPLNSPTVSPSDPRWVGQTLEPTTDLFQGLGLVEGDGDDRAQAISPDTAAVAAASETSSMETLSSNSSGFEAEDVPADDGVDDGLTALPEGVVVGPNGEVVALVA